jgi:hypothetical protein
MNIRQCRHYSTWDIDVEIGEIVQRLCQTWTTTFDYSDELQNMLWLLVLRVKAAIG